MSVLAPERPAAAPTPPPVRAPQSRATSTLAFRAVLTARGAGVFDAVRSATAEWVTRKHGAAPLATGQHQLGEIASFTSQVIYGGDGHESAIRLQLREETEEATWRTTVTAAETGPTVTTAVSLEVFPNPGHRPHPAWPALIRALTAAIHPLDGPARLTCAAQSITAFDVPFLIDILCDPERRMPAIVAARPLRPDRTWSGRMGKAMPLCAGAASLYLLEDTAAVDAFRDAAGPHHRIAPGSVRTYLPELDPAWPSDAPRHRLVSGARMSDPDDQAWHAIHNSVHRLATTATMPPPLRTLIFPAVGERHREQRAAALAAADAGTETAALRREVEELRELLTIADQDLREAAVEAGLAAESAAALEHQGAEAGERADAADEDALWALAEAERAVAELAAMRNRLYAAGRHEEAAIEITIPAPPASFEQLWERASELDGLILTADRATALRLDEHERARVWAGKAWQGLRALDSYATAVAAGFTGGFYAYCRGGHAGAEAGFSANQVVITESEATMQGWGHERIFPVPAAIDRAGVAEMQAHLRLERKTATSPRLYFYDDTKGPTGRVIVGYLGPHLTNTLTN